MYPMPCGHLASRQVDPFDLLCALLRIGRGDIQKMGSFTPPYGPGKFRSARSRSMSRRCWSLSTDALAR